MIDNNMLGWNAVYLLFPHSTTCSSIRGPHRSNSFDKSHVCESMQIEYQPACVRTSLFRLAKYCRLVVHRQLSAILHKQCVRMRSAK